MNAVEQEAGLTRDLVEVSGTRKSWRERLQWVRDRLADPAFAPTPQQLATVAIYLRFLATGELRCEEDGRHFRPNHHAATASEIEATLERLTTPETGWILRRIYPYLPSWGEAFRRSEPLTRIRDIAHRNDIPSDLKREIKHRLQNKLHRCAAPEDLRTSEELLRRITAPGASCSEGFVREFRVFHAELLEFFNATGVEKRLHALAETWDAAGAEAVRAFLASKAGGHGPDEQLLELLDRLTTVRQLLADRMASADPLARSRLRLADIGLEDHTFPLLGDLANRLEKRAAPAVWGGLLRAVAAALDNLRLSLVEPEECAALRSELSAWAEGFRVDDRFHLLRVLATLSRAQRLAESYTDRISALFPPLVEALGRGLGIADHAIRIFTEGDIRGHVVFPFSRLLDLGLRVARAALQLPPWEAVVPGEASGLLKRRADLADAENDSGTILLLDRADGDAEIPAGVRGIILGHPLPHLSHLGVRARQARVPFAATAVRERLRDFDHLLGKAVRVRVTSDGLAVEANAAPTQSAQASAPPPPPIVPEVALTPGPSLVPLDQAEPATCGAKAAGARRLLELAAESGGLFLAPRGLVVPFGVMARGLDEVPEVGRAYRDLRGRLAGAPREQLEPLLQRLRELVQVIPVHEEVGRAVAAFFGPETRLAVRSSANGEDLENLAGAGLYESVVNVAIADVPRAIGQVWASLWTRRAALSRAAAGIPHERLHMAVLIQELVAPDLSFILHTVNPTTGNRAEAVAELAVGLGEILASAARPGTPYRLVCDRNAGTAALSACATFNVALRPSPAEGRGIVEECLNYSRIPLSADGSAAPRLGTRLTAIASLLEDRLGRPQDVEGVCVGEGIFIVQARPQQGL